jgi:hypothetical protein
MENLQGTRSGAKLIGRFEAEIFGMDGNPFSGVHPKERGFLKARTEGRNLVTNVGLDHILDVVLHGSTPVSPWYVGLKNTGSPAAGDTMASHAGWTENANYDEATRQEYEEAAASSQSTTNSANKATFTIDTDSQTIYGAFLCSDSTKSGSTGTLLCVANFASAKSCDDDDVLEVTYTISAADDGV